MAITVFTVYFLTLAVLVLADIVQSWAGILVLLMVGIVGAVVITATGRMTRR